MATDPRTVTMPVVGLGTDDDFSLLASACRGQPGHLVRVCLHGVSVYAAAVALALGSSDRQTDRQTDCLTVCR